MERTFKIPPDLAKKVIELAQPPSVVDEVTIEMNLQTEVSADMEFCISEVQAEKVLSKRKPPMIIQAPETISNLLKR